MSNADHLLRFLKHIGVDHFGEIVSCLHRCGFDEAIYLCQNEDLRASGHDAAAAMLHFLAHGLDENRKAPAAPLPDGLERIEALEVPSAAYKRRLFRAVFFAQLKNPETAARLWEAIDVEFIDRLRAMGGIPYYVVGDSHAALYVRNAAFDKHWLAPLPLVCPGASAIGLASRNSRMAYGSKILRWAERLVRHRRGLAAPAFLKFGGLDAEFLWMSRRIESGIFDFPGKAFSEFAARSVEEYGTFLGALSDIVGAPQLRVCSVFPSVLDEPSWTAGFIQAFGRSAAYNSEVRAELAKVPDFPSLRLRTKYRQLYNKWLKRACTRRGIVFVDDFSPLLGADEIVDDFYVRRQDFHIDYAASEGPIVGLIKSHLGLADVPRPHPSAALAPTRDP